MDQGSVRQFIEINTWKDALHPGKCRDNEKVLYIQQSGGHSGKGAPSSHTAQVAVLREKNANTLELGPPNPCHRMAGMRAPGMHTIHNSKTLVM